MKRIVIVIGVVAACGLLALWLVFSNLSLAALPEPGRNETYLATKAKHLLIARATREGVPPRPFDKAKSAAQGDKLYAIRCSLCHGEDGRTPSPMGQWMYPRAADLTSATVRSYSDEELFWILKNGIRLSGMPAFGKLESDEHLWNVVDHLHTLQAAKR
jgi:mono/diheme cytochrome c family protein